jgi:hypothetical protein
MKVFFERRLKYTVVGRDLGKQSHRGPELHVIGRTKDFQSGPCFHVKNSSRAFFQSRAKNWVQQISLRFFAAGDGKFDRSWASPQTPDLRKNKPHPVAHFRSSSQLGERSWVDPILSQNETIEVVGIHRTALRTCGQHGFSLDKFNQSSTKPRHLSQRFHILTSERKARSCEQN